MRTSTLFVSAIVSLASFAAALPISDSENLVARSDNASLEYVSDVVAVIDSLTGMVIRRRGGKASKVATDSATRRLLETQRANEQRKKKEREEAAAKKAAARTAAAASGSNDRGQRARTDSAPPNYRPTPGSRRGTADTVRSSAPSYHRELPAGHTLLGPISSSPATSVRSGRSGSSRKSESGTHAGPSMAYDGSGAHNYRGNTDPDF
ncbi:hypothetical protein C8J56DRAFT_1029251 [Mycena floridula]|nr:hypothetical protein C8J56DRAFT_1029251 [Mycena floridula]